jgi:hypothetical protein
MATGKKSFVLYSDQRSIIDMLPNGKAGILLKHIFAYVNDENPVNDDPLILLAFEPIKLQMKRDLIKWETTKEGRSVAGKASAEARKLLKETQQSSTNSTNVNFVQQSSTNSTVNVNDNVNVNVNDNVSVIKTNTEKSKRFIPPTLQEVENYCFDRMNNISPQHFIDHYTSNGWLVGKNKMKDWQSAIRNWERTNKQFNNNQNGTTKINDGSGLIAWVNGK